MHAIKNIVSPLLLILTIVLFFLLATFLAPKSSFAQIPCTGEFTRLPGICGDPVITCMFDGNNTCPPGQWCCVNPQTTNPGDNAFMCDSACSTYEPNCFPGFTLPAGCNPNNWQRCCADLYLDNFGVCQAPAYTSCVLENPPPDCANGLICTGLDQSLCANIPGATPGACSTSNGSIGSCCQPSGCPANHYCEDIGPAACRADQGQVIDCYLDNSQTARCCLPGTRPTTCPTGYDCEQVVGGLATCNLNRGIFQSCTQNNITGNCCIPGQGIYGCGWNGRCYTDIAGATHPYTCGTNFGHCVYGDPNCTSCDDPSLTQEECLGMNPNPCIEQTESIGYYCAGPTIGCYPCFEWNRDPNSPFYIPYCDPPAYRGRTPEENYNACVLACTGQVPTRYSCSNSRCIEDGDGPYESMVECASNCATSGTCFGDSGMPGTCSFLFCNPLTEVFDGRNPQNPSCHSNPEINQNYWCCRPIPPIDPPPVRYEANPFLGCVPEYPAGGASLQVIEPPEQCIINTAIGCIPVYAVTPFSLFLLRFFIGIGGGTALLLIAYSSFIITTSSGNPAKLQAGKELLVAALSGLGLIIFSTFILQLIGVEILRLPGL